MASHRNNRQAFVIVASNGLMVEDTREIGKEQAITAFLKAVGYTSADISQPLKRERCWDVYKKKGFSCVSEERFHSEMDEVDRVVDERIKQEEASVDRTAADVESSPEQ